MKKLFIVLAIMLFCRLSFAAIITLNSDEKINGEIVVETADSIKVDIGIGIPVTYYKEDIKSIKSENEPVEESKPSPLEEIEKRRQERPKKPLSQRLMPKKTEEEVLMEKVMSKVNPGQNNDNILNEETEAYANEDIINKDDVRYAAYKFRDFLFNSYLKSRELWEEYSPKILRHEIIAGVLAVFFIYHLLFCFPLILISRKLLLEKWSWLAWVPILQIYLMVKLAEKPFMWVLLLFVPIINIFIFISIWTRISQILQKSFLLGFLMFIPLVNIGIVWYLATAKIK